MVKVGLPPGLIRYASEKEIEEQQQFKFSGRMKIYSVVLLLLVGFLGGLLYSRGDMEAKFLKPPGATFFVREGKITNTYNYTFLNKSNENRTVIIKIIEPANGEISSSTSSNKIVLKRDVMTKGTINVSFPENQIKLSKQNLTLGVYDMNGELLDSYNTYFEGPFKFQF
ncbi:Ubp3 associated protein Bre5 [compost metagenome]